jgi:AraC-like DNA-binding protein
MANLPGIWLLDAFRRGGVDTEELSARIPELVDLMLRDPSSLRPDAVNRILIESEALSGDVNFGLHMVEHVDVSMYGTYGYLLLNAPTVGQFLRIAERYYATFYQGAGITNSTSQGMVRFEYRPHGSSSVSPRHDNEWTLGFFVNFIRERVRSDWCPRSVTFTNAPPAKLGELHRVFGTSISFYQATTGFEFEESLTRQTINDADPRLLEILTGQAEAMLFELECGAFKSAVRLEILELLETGEATAELVAGRMAMSVSTLKRQLQREGSSFRSLRDDVIREVASRALAETDTSASNIALKLGYSELSAFHRAFRRLTGSTPSDFRRAHRGRTGSVPAI